MAIRLNLICTYSKNQLIGVLIPIAYPFSLLRLDNYVVCISSVTYKLYLLRRLCEFKLIYTLILVGPTQKSDRRAEVKKIRVMTE